MHRLDFSSSDELNKRLCENSSDDSHGFPVDPHIQGTSTQERKKLPRINISPRKSRNFDNNYEISPPPSPPIYPHRNYKSKKAKPQQKTNPEDYKIRVINKNDQGCTLIIENPNDPSKKTNKRLNSNYQIPRVSLTPMEENEPQTPGHELQNAPSPRSNYPQPHIPSPISPPLSEPKHQIYRPKQTSAKKKRTKPEDFHARIIERYSENEWVAVISVEPETESNSNSTFPSSYQNNQPQSTTVRNGQFGIQSLSRQPIEISSDHLHISDEDNSDNYYHGQHYYSNESESNSYLDQIYVTNTERSSRQMRIHDSDSESNSYRDDNCKPAYISDSDENFDSSDSDPNKAHWDTDKIEDKKGPWTEYRITLKDVKEGANCSICFDNFKKGEKVSKLNCNHFFHDDCILMWYDQNRNNPTCPICRRDMNDHCQCDKKTSDDGCIIC